MGIAAPGSGALGFLTVHGARRILMVVVIVPLIGWSARRRGLRREQLVQIRYAIAGLFLGGAWIWRADAPAWEHALRLVAVLLVVAPLIHLLRQRVARRRGLDPRRAFPLRAWILAKAGIVGVGFGLEWALEGVIGREHAALAVGVGIALTLAVGGPYFHRRVEARRTPRPPDDRTI